MCIKCGKSNATKVEVDKQKIFYTMGNNTVVNNVERQLHKKTNILKHTRTLIGFKP